MTFHPTNGKVTPGTFSTPPVIAAPVGSPPPPDSAPVPLIVSYEARASCTCSMWASAQEQMPATRPTSDRPRAVSEHSTRGGTLAYRRRVTARRASLQPKTLPLWSRRHSQRGIGPPNRVPPFDRGTSGGGRSRGATRRSGRSDYLLPITVRPASPRPSLPAAPTTEAPTAIIRPRTATCRRL
jgi:hypothetical protein